MRAASPSWDFRYKFRANLGKAYSCSSPDKPTKFAPSVTCTLRWYSVNSPLREQDFRRVLVLLARWPAECHSLSESHSLSDRYISVTTHQTSLSRVANGLASAPCAYNWCASIGGPKRALWHFTGLENQRKMGAFTIFSRLRRM